MRLGELDRIVDVMMKSHPRGATVTVGYPEGTAGVVKKIISYRGYYDQPALLTVPLSEVHPSNLGEFREQIHEALAGKVFHGYKGGEYTYDENSPVWVTKDPGDHEGLAVVGWQDRETVLMLTVVDISDYGV